MRTPSRFLQGTLLLFTACGSGGPEAAPPPGPMRLEVVSLEVPEQATEGRSIHVAVEARDAVGIAGLEVHLGDGTWTASGRGGSFETLGVDVPAPGPGLYRLEIVLQGADGVVGTPVHRLLSVGERDVERDPFMDTPFLLRRIEAWIREGGTDEMAYPRGDLYAAPTLPGIFDPVGNWWRTWATLGGPQPFDWATHCPDAGGVTLSGEVLHCWLDLNPQVAQAMRWDVLDVATGNVTTLAYPSWTPSMKQDLDTSFFYTWSWIASGLQTPFPIPPDPSINMIPSTSQGAVVALSPQQAWVLYAATVAHSLALEIGGLVPWSVLNYGTDDLLNLFSSQAMFTAEHRDYTDVSYTGYWPGEVLHAYPKTTFQFFVDEDIIRGTHKATITRLLEWSGSHLIHYSSYNNDTDGKTDMQVAYMHWQYYGMGPVQRMLAGTLRDNTNQVKNWTRGCTGTSSLYHSILRNLNIPAYTQFGWGENGEPHLDGHTVPVFPTIGMTMSHADEVLNWYLVTDDVTPPPTTVSSYAVLISWDTFVDWFFTHPDHNVGRQRMFEIPIDVLPDEVLDLHCQDLLLPYFTPLSQTAVYARFSDHYTVNELVARDLWTRLSQKVALLGFCD